MLLKNLVQSKYLLWKISQKISAEEILRAKEEYLLIVKPTDGEFLLYRREGLLSFFNDHQSLKEIYLEKTIASEKYIALSENLKISAFPWIEAQETLIIVIDKEKRPLGIIENAKNLSYVATELNSEISHQRMHLDFYKKIIDTIEEEILITDEYGFIQFVNPWAIRISGATRQELIGKHMLDYEKTCILDTSSVALDVLKNHRKVHKMMKMKTGNILLATGIPMYDDKGKLTNAMSTSKDVDEIANLFHQLTHQEHDVLVKKQQQEIIRLNERIISKDNYVMISESMQEIQDIIIKIASRDVTILIEGESGSGKEVICNLIHKLSQRHGKPLIKINCGAIPEHLLESELFGYEPGAFTGAGKGGKIGIIELSHDGTLFLDEIGEMPLALQVKLLEFLQDRKIIRVGGVKKIPINTRVIAATNANLRKMVKEGTFRGDLYYRLNVFPITLPPLRKRQPDIIPLALLFLERFNNKYGVDKNLSRGLLQGLLEYNWPGNVRELMNVIERLVLIAENDNIEIDILKNIFHKNRNINKGEKVANVSLKDAKRDFEFQLVRKAYEKYKSSYKAAAALGINQSTVIKILKKNKYTIK